MSRLYEMSVEITGYDRKKVDEIIEAAEQEWGFDGDLEEHESDKQRAVIRGCGQDSLCGGESDADFSNRLAAAIFKANGGKPCKVKIVATYMEDLPCETYTFDEKKPPK